MTKLSVASMAMSALYLILVALAVGLSQLRNIDLVLGATITLLVVVGVSLWRSAIQRLSRQWQQGFTIGLLLLMVAGWMGGTVIAQLI